MNTVFRNGHVFDGHRYRRDIAVAVSDGRIVAVGADDEAASYAGAGAVEVDLAGGLLLPGFQDAHVHPLQGGLERTRCSLSDLGTREEYLAEVARYAKANPDLDWICGGGWSMAVFPGGTPEAADLDAVVPDRPVFLPNRDHHGVWVNSRALEVAGIDARTPDPVDGRIERTPDGTPTGTLHEGAMELVAQHIPATSDEQYYQALLVAQEYLHSLGITAWQDAILGEYAGTDDTAPTYLRASQRGELSAAVVGALWWERERGAEQIEGLIDRREQFSHGRLRATSVKIMQDGVAENFTAGMTAPYLDGCGCRSGNAGLSFVDPEDLKKHVTVLDAAGFQVHFHAIGDRAVREALDAFEAARSVNGRNDSRHQIAHVQMVHPDDRARFTALGVCANIQPLWACLDQQIVELTIPFLSPERVAWQYPFGDLARAGVHLAAGSDWPVSSPNPLLGIHVAVNRWGYGEPGPAGSETFLPEQRLSLEQGFAAYTSGAAFVNHLDDTGTLQVGKRADLAILDRDPFAGDLAEVGAATVVATYVGGTPVYG